MTRSDAVDVAYHVPVMLQECLEYLQPHPGDVMMDATFGGGGHSAAIAAAIAPGGTLIAVDRDSDAIREGTIRIRAIARDIEFVPVHSAFGDIEDTAENGDCGLPANVALNGAFFDLGVSSHQLDTSRGFSFRRDEPLDMRMNAASAERTAADLLAEEPGTELARIIREYGEERWADRIAGALVERRKTGNVPQTTAALAETVSGAIPRKAWPPDKHPATRTFQALRIAVNDELGQLERGLAMAFRRCAAGGRIVVISYHSLEDRIVKQAMVRAAGREPSPSGYSPALFAARADAPTQFEIVTRKPAVPDAREVRANPRARSAKLRAAVRVK